MADNAPSSPQAVSLAGTGSGPAVVLSPLTLAYSGVSVGSTSGSLTLTLNNTGNAALSINGIALTGANPADFAESSTCGNSVLPSGSCSINLTFSPSAAGSRTASLILTDNATNSPQTVNVSGTGNAPLAGVTPAGLNFSSQNVGTTSSTQSVTLTNNGNAALSIGGVALMGVNPGDFAETTTCGSALAASGSCTIRVTFAPTLPGSRTAMLSITDNSSNATGSVQSVPLTGTGNGPGSASHPPASLSGVKPREPPVLRR